MQDEGIPLFSTEGLSLVGAGLMLIVFFVVMNRGMSAKSNSPSDGTIGVRG